MERIDTFFNTLFLFVILGLTSIVTPAHTESAARIMTALRINPHPPKIDGRLDDAIWQQSPVSSDFLQLDPVEGEAASEKTTVQIAYDEEGLYVGIRCYDGDSEGIVSRLTRRDGETEARWRDGRLITR